MADFSYLPDVVWVNILSYLPLIERAKVARTCHTLNDLFSHPSLWYSVKIVLLSSNQRNDTSTNILLPTKYVTMISKYGNYFQDLNLIFTGYMSGIPSDITEVLTALAKCRLEKLSLTVGVNLSKREFTYQRPLKLDIAELLILVEKAFRLKTLDIKAWPMHKNVRSPNILETLRKNKKIENLLENLTLFWTNAEDTSWATLNATLPSPAETLLTVQHLPHLKILKLRSTMVSNDLIMELAKFSRKSFKRLSVLVTYSSHGGDKLPEISSKAWQLLKESLPDLEVDFTISTRIPYIELAGLLKPEIPVCALIFMKHSECRTIDLQSVTDKFAKSLVKFSDYSQSSNVDEALIQLVKKCEKLNWFVYNGTINHETVTCIAKIRGTAWVYFQIDSSNVITHDYQCDNDDEIIRQNPNGEYEVVAHSLMKAVDDTLDREAVLEVMIHEVAEYLGKKWIPVDLLKRPDIEELKNKLYFQN